MNGVTIVILAISKKMKKILCTLIVFVQVVHGVDISEKEHLSKACDKGDIEACFKFAEFYFSGIYHGVYDRSYYKVLVEPYRKACYHGKARACERLGHMYVFARGVDRDIRRGYRLYAKSCDMNDSWGCSDLGFIYREGYSSILRQDYRKALKYYEKACSLSKSHYIYDCNERDELLKLIKE